MNGNGKRAGMTLFFLLIAAVALGNGLSDAVYSNYYKDAYDITAAQRAFIEFPRELPGVLCALVIAGLSVFGDLKLSLLAQILACVGLVALGVFTPPFGVMLIFLFVNSLGMHLFMPLADGVGMALAEPNHIGRRMGQYASVKTGVGFVAGIITFLGFRLNWFSFTTPVKWIFLAGAASFVVAIALSAALIRRVPMPTVRRRVRFVFRREYRFYYLLTILHGVQKQIAFVFGAWVIVDLLRKGADVMSLLAIASSFLGIFFMNLIGRWMDKFGIRRMMFLEALIFIVLYTVYGFVVWGITSSVLPSAGLAVMAVYGLFVLDKLSMQLSIVKSVYLRSIALEPGEITATLSTGTSLDHIVSILAAQFSGWIWMQFGPQWVFFMAAALSFGNLLVAAKVRETKAEVVA